jgi:Putative transposase
MRVAWSTRRVQLNAAGQVERKLKITWRDGTTHLVMSPLGFMQRLAALVPRPRLHLIRFHGVLAPNAKLPQLAVPQEPTETEQTTEPTAAADCEIDTARARPGRISWARLLKQVFDFDMQHCPICGGGELKIIAAILELPVIEKILTHLGLDPQPPPRGRAREAGHDVAA